MGEAKQPDSVRSRTAWTSPPPALAHTHTLSPNPQRLQPDAIAETYVHLAEQPRNCWAFGPSPLRPSNSRWVLTDAPGDVEIDLRPSVETW